MVQRFDCRKIAQKRATRTRACSSAGSCWSALARIGRQEFKQTGAEQKLEGAAGPRLREESEKLLGNPSLGALGDLAFVLHHAAVGLRLDAQIAAGSEFHRPQDANRILAEADVGIANGSHQPRFQVGDPVDVVDDLAGLDVIEETV